MTQKSVLIVGAGHAGFQVAVSLRQHGFGERICLINDEAHLPYQRPPLSKAYLKGEGRPDSLMFRPDKFYRDQNIELISDRAAFIDRAAHRLLLASGAFLDYGHLVLATGARNRLLDLPNANLADVKYLRILDESEALRQRIGIARHVAVIGAGFIGLEFAATARAKGLEVDVIELGFAGDGSRRHGRDLGLFSNKAHLGRHPHSPWRASDQHRERGRKGCRRQPQRRPSYPGRSGRRRRRRVAECRTGRGGRPPCRLGHYRQRASLTADPDISAIGDCALFASPRFGGSLRLESVQNATDQARCVAARLTGDAKAYDGLPWFWSDQGDDKLQIAGLTTGYDQVVVRGDREARSFSAFCYKQGQLVGIELVNRAADHVFGRKILGLNRSIEAEKAADLGFDLKSALA